MKPTCKASLNTTELASSAKLNTDENDATIIDQAHSHIYVGSTYLSGRQVRPIKNNYLRMKNKLFTLLISLILLSCNSYKKLTYLQNIKETGIDTLYPKQQEVYKIQPADILYIKVITSNKELYDHFNSEMTGTSGSYAFREEGLYLTGYSVDDSGYVELPVLQKIKVSDLTIDQIKQIITENAKLFLNDVQVIVKLATFRFTVLGEVKSPGIKLVRDEQVNLLEAIAYAGDITYNGNRANILLLRPTKDGTKTFRMDLTDDKLLSSKEFFLLPNDIIYVEPLHTTLFRERTKDYLFVLSVLTTTVSAMILILNFINK